MALIIQKYGGTSVADADRIRTVADYVARSKRRGDDVVVVVSAMGKTTDDLVRLAGDVSATIPPREMDMLLTAGERISVSLLCMALADLGVAAESFTGSQAGIITDTDHTKAKIVEIKPDRIKSCLAAGVVPVIAGFQGVSTERNVTTLGRGGSDTTAVAIAASLGATVCERYTDVSGVFTADPRVVPSARKIPRISFDEMLELSASGGRVLALRSVEFARNYGVTLHVRSSFTWEPGTWVVEEEETMEQAVVSAISHDASEVKLTLLKVPDRPGVAAHIFRVIADAGVNIDMIVQNTSIEGLTDISFTAPKLDLELARRVTEDVARQVGASEVISDTTIGRVSLIGAGMRSHPGVTATMFETLANHNINIEMISTSAIRISCVIRVEQLETAVQALHEAFSL
ncbi:aspartate kinase [Ferrimicrobium acidiphilum]|uniref:aspartate kinase n=1 Tax=Ferrimicrobium acidiphilum TaxID=121039 RepID=UPI0023F2AD6C|nr:aspartate kinase [Ferrimicrobium acidiphilum]